jgi:multidrug efflux pump subunit AcrB
MEKAGLSPFQMKQFIEQAFLKMPIGQMSMDDEIVPVTVQWSKQTTSKADLLDLKIPTLTGEQKLSNFIELKVVEAPNEINHMDGERLITISVDIEGKDRLRPIFMTMLTTVGGMLPLALASGTSGNYQAPMATVIISGLLFATIITLWLIPAVYRLVTIRGLRFSLFKKGQKKAKVQAVPKPIG